MAQALRDHPDEGAPALIRQAAAAALLAGAACVAGPAAAQGREPLGFDLTLATDHRSKGASKTGGRAQAALAYGRDLPADLRLGLRATNLRNSAGSDAQLDVSLAWRPEAAGVDWELELTREHYPGSDTQANTAVWQIGAEAARSFGPARGALLIQHQPNGFADTGANTYLAVEAGWRLRPGLQAVAGAGRRDQERSVSYSAWNAGLVLDVAEQAALDVRWHATDRDEAGPNFRDRLVGALRVSF